MYAVIFKAKVKDLDETYFKTASRMRELALNEYECTEFIALTEADQEIAISYWPSLDAIKKWKQNSEHLIAQELGQSQWYDSYSVEITEIKQSYSA